MDTLTNCPLCGNNRLEPFLSVTDFSISKEVFLLCRCIECDFVFTNPRPDKSSLSKYYESPDYISHSNSKTGLFNKTYQLIRKYSINRKIGLLSKFAVTDKTLLDIGCGTGEFLSACQKMGWNVMGIEPNAKARNSAIALQQLDVKNETFLNNIPSKSFKTITLWHVLEHVYSLRERISEISRLLKDDGHIVVAVPNYKSYDAAYYKEFWAAYDVPRHLYHFSEKTVKNLFITEGFEWVASFPMKFDSYYVSILSEKYKNSNLGLIKAVYQGMKSNLITRGKPEKYSSVIYVFKKK